MGKFWAVRESSRFSRVPRRRAWVSRGLEWADCDCARVRAQSATPDWPRDLWSWQFRKLPPHLTFGRGRSENYYIIWEFYRDLIAKIYIIRHDRGLLLLGPNML